MTFEFTIQGIATQGSKRHVGGGRMIESCKRLPEWRAELRMLATSEMQKAGRTLTLNRCGVTVNIYKARPKCHYKADGELSALGKRSQAPTSKPDVDKVLRAVLDGLTGIVYKDDAQITAVIVHKWWAATDSVKMGVFMVADNAN